MTERDARILLTVFLIAVICLTAFLLLSQIAAGTVDALAAERAGVEAQASAVAGTLTAIK